MKDIRLNYFPSAQRIDPDDFEVYFTIESVESTIKAPAIVVHTFDALESSEWPLFHISSCLRNWPLPVTSQSNSRREFGICRL